MKNIFKILIIALVFGFLSCEKTEEDYVPPSVVTLNAESISSGGVILKGDFRNFDKDHELGFFINNNINPILVNPKEGENTISISKGLYYNQEYTFHAYIKTDTEVFYGLQESFLSTGSAQVSLSNISPNKGNYYDVVEIETDFALDENDQNDIRIYFNNTRAEINSIASNKISCTVPYFEGDFISNISLEYFGKKLESSLNFELLKPSITSVSKNEVTFNDELIINGKNFENGYNTNLKVYIDNFEANIIEKSGAVLKVKIPNDVESKTPIIKISSNQQVLEVENLISLKDPIISSYPNNVKPLDEITLSGENFNPDTRKNTVYFDGAEAQIISGDANNLKVKVPTGVYEDWELSITVEVSEELKSIEYPISILGTAIEVEDNLEIDIRNFQVIGSDIYVYGRSVDVYSQGELEVYKFSLDNNKFYDKKIIELPSQSAFYIVKSDTEFLYVYFKRGNSNFYKISLVTGSVEKLNDFPGGERIMGHGITYNGNVYLGLGRTGTTYDNIDFVDFYEYNVISNTWKKLPDVLNGNTFDYIYRSFYHENLAYIFINNYSNNIRRLKFDGTNYINQNLSISNYPIGGYYFFRDNKFYFVEDNHTPYENIRLKVFNTSNNTWQIIPDIVPSDDSVIGIIHYQSLLFVETVDYHLNRHLFKVDLNRL